MTWVSNNLDLIGQLALSHLLLALPAIILTLLISLPIGWVAHRYRWSRLLTLTAAGLIYAIPSLPLLIMLPLIFGFGVRDDANVIAALTLYGIALMVRSVSDGLDAVPAEPVLAARALGMSTARRFFTVELPLAGPAMLAGLRVVSVSTIALVTVSAVLGTRSLGMLFTDGFQRNIVAEVGAGIIGTVALALLFDALLVVGGRLVLPWVRGGRA